MREMRLMRWLRVPAAFISANWAGLLAIVVLGLVPAAAGNQRVMSRLDHHADEAGTVVLRQLRRTWWRDLPVSLGMLVYLGLGAATVALMAWVYEGPVRVYFVGMLVPVYWVVGAAIAAYVRAAATMPLTATRTEVLSAAGHLALTYPVRALLTVPATVLAAPAYVLAPLTVACGLSLPAWVLAQIWRVHPAIRGARPAQQGAT
ncbi:hypothetical protein [Pseudactinotalea sp.]|uniref:hypothetical protein n=1 Tax=Pseudactinotalea sp. TaxID=1926260 RepID=UPI003B3A4EF6